MATLMQSHHARVMPTQRSNSCFNRCHKHTELAHTNNTLQSSAYLGIQHAHSRRKSSPGERTGVSKLTEALSIAIAEANVDACDVLYYYNGSAVLDGLTLFAQASCSELGPRTRDHSKAITQLSCTRSCYETSLIISELGSSCYGWHMYLHVRQSVCTRSTANCHTDRHLPPLHGVSASLFKLHADNRVTECTVTNSLPVAVKAVNSIIHAGAPQRHDGTNALAEHSTLQTVAYMQRAHKASVKRVSRPL
eukprot:6565-Heterococcus_DN1.PRE.2